MKNIHVLPTKLASEYYITKEGKLGESYSLKRGGAVHFYITNDEKIKEGDWFLNDMNILFKADKNYIENPAKEVYIGHKKIILTTDQDLIKDGVQAIDDEFLEWFVKNPSCEKVELKYKDHWDSAFAYYEIIIPKEATNNLKTNKMKQTAVEFLLINLLNKFPKEMEYLFSLDKNLIEDILKKAKEMEKQQIADAYKIGRYENDKIVMSERYYAEQYYNETYNK